jgi:hypothetical protein
MRLSPAIAALPAFLQFADCPEEFLHLAAELVELAEDLADGAFGSRSRIGPRPRFRPRPRLGPRSPTRLWPRPWLGSRAGLALDLFGPFVETACELGHVGGAEVFGRRVHQVDGFGEVFLPLAVARSRSRPRFGPWPRSRFRAMESGVEFLEFPADLLDSLALARPGEFFPFPLEDLDSLRDFAPFPLAALGLVPRAGASGPGLHLVQVPRDFFDLLAQAIGFLMLARFVQSLHLALEHLDLFGQPTALLLALLRILRKRNRSEDRDGRRTREQSNQQSSHRTASSLRGWKDRVRTTHPSPNTIERFTHPTATHPARDRSGSANRLPIWEPLSGTTIRV